MLNRGINSYKSLDNLELIEFKAYSTATWILIPFSNSGCCFQKIPITFNLGQNCWDEIENLFFSEKTLLLPSQFCLQTFSLLTTILGQIQHWHSGIWGRNWNLKNWVISWFYWISTFVWTSFVQDCSYSRLYSV